MIIVRLVPEFSFERRGFEVFDDEAELAEAYPGEVHDTVTVTVPGFGVVALKTVTGNTRTGGDQQP